MAQSSKLPVAMVGGAATAALLGWLLLRNAPEPTPSVAPTPTLAATPTATPTPTRAAPPTPVPAPTAAPEPDARPAPFSPFSFLSPEATVSTQVRLLQEGNDEAFRETFLPSVRDKVTPDAIAACRKRLSEVRVQPDWEKADDTVVDGHKVQSVSMWGKGLTGFHDVDGKWLADGLWCVPYGLP